MKQILLITIESDDEGEIDGMINSIQGTITRREMFADHDINARCTYGLFQANKDIRAMAKEDNGEHWDLMSKGWKS